MPKHLRVKANLSGRDFVVGDLHGMYSSLQKQLSQVNFNEQFDRLFCVGDLIDRGHDSLACLGLLEEPWFFTVRGNHEQMCIDDVLGGDELNEKIWYYNGGNWSVDIDRRQLKKLAKKLKKLPWTIEIQSPVAGEDPVGICHAEYPLTNWGQRTRAKKETFYHELIWSRKQATSRHIRVVRGVQAIYCGHTIFSEPMQLGNCHFIDIGGFQTGRLYLKEIFSKHQ